MGRDGTTKEEQGIEHLVVPEYSQVFDPRLLSEYERESIEKRLSAARRQVSGAGAYTAKLLPETSTLPSPKPMSFSVHLVELPPRQKKR